MAKPLFQQYFGAQTGGIDEYRFAEPDAAFATKNAISILTSKNWPAITGMKVIVGQFLNYILMILILIPF